MTPFNLSHGQCSVLVVMLSACTTSTDALQRDVAIDSTLATDVRTTDTLRIDSVVRTDGATDQGADVPSSSMDAARIAFSASSTEVGTDVALPIPVTVFDARNAATSAFVNFASSNPQVLEVNAQTRTMTGRALGTATISATVAGQRSMLEVQVHLGFRVVRTGFAHGCGLDGRNRPWCWGCNHNGQAGTPVRSSGGRTVLHRPTLLSGVPTATEGALAIGWKHTCMLADTGQAYCWGYGDQGQLGVAAGQSDPVPVHASLRFAHIEAGQSFTCASTADGHLYCWGANDSGQLGDGTNTAHPNATRVGTLVVRAFSLGNTHACAISSDGALYCWGGNDSGQLGIGTFGGNRTSPQRISDGPYQSVELGENYSCALNVAGQAFCFGRDEQDKGAMGIGISGNVHTPTAVVGAARFSMLAAGFRSTCGLQVDGALYCWGSNDFGLLANGSIQRDWRELMPQPAFDIGVRYQSIALTRKQPCAISTHNVVYCWGENPTDTLGTPAAESESFVNPPTRLEDSDGTDGGGTDYPSC